MGRGSTLCVYNILAVHMAIRGISRAQLAAATGMRYNVLCYKLRGERFCGFTLAEAIAIRKALGLEALDLAVLFRRGGVHEHE